MFRFAIKKSTLRNDFSEDAANRPEINRRRVLGGTKQQLWRSIPQRDYLSSVWAYGNAECSGETEVSNFEIVINAEQNVLRFEVSVNDSPGVTGGDSAHELIHVPLDEHGREVLAGNDGVDLFLEV